MNDTMSLEHRIAALEIAMGGRVSFIDMSEFRIDETTCAQEAARSQVERIEEDLARLKRERAELFDRLRCIRAIAEDAIYLAREIRDRRASETARTSATWLASRLSRTAELLKAALEEAAP